MSRSDATERAHGDELEPPVIPPVDEPRAAGEEPDDGGARVLRGPEADRPDRARRRSCSSSASTSCCRRSLEDQSASRKARRRERGLDPGRGAASRSRCSPPTWRSSRASSASASSCAGSESYEITMAGLAATRLFSAGGAGGIVLTYWALRKAGMPRKETASRMVAFLVLLYAVYMLAADRRDPAADRCLRRPGAARADDRPGGDRRRGDRDLPADGARPGRPRAALLAGEPGERLGQDGAPPGDRSLDAASAPARRSPSSAIRRGAALAIVGAVGFWAPRSGSSGRRSTPSASGPAGRRRRRSSSACSRT